MDILLINPGQIRHDYITEHLGIANLKSYVISRGFSADMLDMVIEKLSVKDGIRIVLEKQPKIVGVSLLDESKDKGLILIKSLRSAGYKGKIVIGGYFATFSSGEILRDFPEIDFIVRGEGEITLVELLHTVLNKQVKSYFEILGLSFRQGEKIVENPPRPLIDNLDILPPVDRKYTRQVLKKNSEVRVYGTRGCWGQCTFCDIIGFYHSSPGKAWRRRSTKHLIDEIEHLQNEFNTNYFIFNDDQFLIKGTKGFELVKEFADELEKRKMNINFELMCRADTVTRPIMSRLKSVGLKRVFLGLESFDPKHQEIYKKRISVRQNFKAIIILYQLNIDVIASVILANTYTTLLDLIKQFITLYEIKGRYFNSPYCKISMNKKLILYRGSAAYQEYKKKGLLTKDNYLEGYEYRIKFWTNFRLILFELEAKISRLILKPVAVFHNLIKSVLWRLHQLRNFSTSPLREVIK